MQITMTAFFESDDFDGWMGNMTEPVTEDDQEQLFQNCLYLADAEDRTLTQSHDELREAISDWAEDRNVGLGYPE